MRNKFNMLRFLTFVRSDNLLYCDTVSLLRGASNGGNAAQPFKAATLAGLKPCIIFTGEDSLCT